MRKISVITILLILVISAAFTNEEFFGFKKPKNFPEPVYDLKQNPVTKNGFELGRKLFYETALSRDGSISCGNCHVQTSGFTQHGHDLSHGIEDRLGNRNSPPIMNLAWSKSFMWDGGVFHLDLFPINPITNPVEMDEKMDRVVAKLRTMPEYPAKFKAAFGSPEITLNMTASCAKPAFALALRKKPGTCYSNETAAAVTKNRCSQTDLSEIMAWTIATILIRAGRRSP
jgi:cytochrome c peroxidase